MRNYRPISNLPFLGKIIERVVSNQLTKYITDNSLLASRQSAYRKDHSVETALLRVQDDLLPALDSGDEAVLILLDLTSAFDTVDNGVLLSRLTTQFGITGTAVKWFESHLSERYQKVTIDGSRSHPTLLRWGVPQGSVVGPVLFTCYTTPLQDIIHSHDFSSMIYADDTQLFITVKSGQALQMSAKLEDCLKAIRCWMTENFLLLNDNKMEVLHLFSNRRKVTELSSIPINNGFVNPSKSVVNLGVTFDQNLSMRPHINQICRKASFALRKIGKIRKFLSKSSTEILVHAFVSSLLDSCNSLLHGIPNKDMAKLQRIQNSAERL